MLSLVVGFAGAQSAMMGEANKPRTGRGSAAALLDVECERLEGVIQQIVAEADTREPQGRDEVEIRAEILTRNAIATRDWETITRAAGEVSRRSR